MKAYIVGRGGNERKGEESKGIDDFYNKKIESSHT